MEMGEPLPKVGTSLDNPSSAQISAEVDDRLEELRPLAREASAFAAALLLFVAARSRDV